MVLKIFIDGKRGIDAFCEERAFREGQPKSIFPWGEWGKANLGDKSVGVSLEVNWRCI